MRKWFVNVARKRKTETAKHSNHSIHTEFGVFYQWYLICRETNGKVRDLVTIDAVHWTKSNKTEQCKAHLIVMWLSFRCRQINRVIELVQLRIKYVKQCVFLYLSTVFDFCITMPPHDWLRSQSVVHCNSSDTNTNTKLSNITGSVISLNPEYLLLNKSQ